MLPIIGGRAAGAGAAVGAAAGAVVALSVGADAVNSIGGSGARAAGAAATPGLVAVFAVLAVLWVAGLLRTKPAACTAAEALATLMARALLRSSGAVAA